MSLTSNLQSGFTRVATEFKTLRSTLGDNANLATTHKSTLVGALNELDAAVDTLSSAEGGATINDASTSSSLVWSSQKTSTEIGTAVSGLVDAAPGALDTLNELAAALGDDPTFATTVTTALGHRVRTDTAAQGLDSTQQGNARANIGAVAASDIGDTETNFVTVFESGLV